MKKKNLNACWLRRWRRWPEAGGRRWRRRRRRAVEAEGGRGAAEGRHRCDRRRRAERGGGRRPRRRVAELRPVEEAQCGGGRPRRREARRAGVRGRGEGFRRPGGVEVDPCARVGFRREWGRRKKRAYIYKRAFSTGRIHQPVQKTPFNTGCYLQPVLKVFFRPLKFPRAKQTFCTGW